MTRPATVNAPPCGCIDTSVLGQILCVGINRPAKRNGLTPQMLLELAQAWTRLDDDPALRVAVLYAVGPHFTAGMDLAAIAEYQRRAEKPVPRDCGLVEPFDLPLPGYRRRNKPLVAAVQGICFTAGVELALSADVVVAADDCRFAQFEVSRGVMAASGATLRMAQRAGIGNAQQILLTGAEFGTPEALRFGFVQEAVVRGAEFDRALAVAECIARQAPQAVMATRLSVRSAVEDGPLVASASLLETQQRLALTEDAIEGRNSFLERRPAVFSGR